MAILSQTAKGDARRAQILAAARLCFMQNGFHATSMQDILKAADISAGAFYRYFPSKEAIVAALAATVITDLTAALSDASGNVHSLSDLLRRVTGAIEQLDIATGTPRIAVQLWGEAQRNENLAATVGDAIRRIRLWFETIVLDRQKAGDLPPGIDPRGTALVLTGLVQGFIVQRTLTEVDAKTYCDGLDGLRFDEPSPHIP